MAQSADVAPSYALEEVIVTATKREESVRDVPVTIVALTAKQLEAQGVQGVEDIAKLVPGVNLTKPGDSALRVTIRGIAAEAGTNPTAGTLFENTSFSDAYLPRVTLDPHPFDLASIEVLKGPQGTLFGAGALNGMIRYVPESAKLGVWESKYFAQYTDLAGGSDGLGYGAVLNAPLSGDELALRVMAFKREAPGYIDNLQTGRKDVNRREQTGARGILAFKPNERFNARLMYAWQQTEDDDSATTDNTNGKLAVSNRPRSSPSSTKYGLASLHLDYALDVATLVSETAYVDKRSDNYVEQSSRLLPGGPLPILGQVDRSRSESWSQEFRVVSSEAGSDPWKWVAGAVASRQDVTYAMSYLLGDPSLPTAAVANILNLAGGLGDFWLELGQPNYVNTATDVRVEEVALFADVTRQLGERWELSAGGRLYRTTSGGIARQSGLLLYALGYNGSHFVEDELREEGFNPRVSLMYRVSDEARIYGAVSRGFRVGGIQPLFAPAFSPVQAPDIFKSDSIWNYEIGARTQWLGRTLLLDTTVFYERWKDPQSFQLDPSGLSSYIDNVGGVESKGVEMALQYLFPIRGLSFSASAAYTDAETTAPYLTATGTVAPAGTQWPLSPKWQTAGSLAYEVEVGSWDLGASVVYTQLDKAIYGLAQPGTIFDYDQWDVRLTLANDASRWFPKITLEGTNLSDRRGITNSFSGATYTDVTYLSPRAVTLRLNGEF